MDVMELVANAKGVAATATAALTAVAVGWWNWRERAWKFDDRKFEPLTSLLADDRWKSVPEIELQRAIKRGFGREISRREFALIYQHENWPAMLRDRLSAGNFVDSLKVEGQFVDGRGPVLKHIPLSVLAFAIGLSGVFSALVMLLAAIVAWNVTMIGFGLTVAHFLLGLYLAAIGPARCDAAKRILSGKHYPRRASKTQTTRSLSRSRTARHGASTSA